MPFFIPDKCPVMKSALSETTTAAPAFFWLVLAWFLFPHPFHLTRVFKFLVNVFVGFFPTLTIYVFNWHS